ADTRVHADSRQRPEAARPRRPYEDRISELDGERSPANRHGEPRNAGQPREIGGSEAGPHHGAPDGLAVPPLLAADLLDSGREIDDTEVDLQDAQADLRLEGEIKGGL